MGRHHEGGIAAPVTLFRGKEAKPDLNLPTPLFHLTQHLRKTLQTRLSRKLGHIRLGVTKLLLPPVGNATLVWIAGSSGSAIQALDNSPLT